MAKNTRTRPAEDDDDVSGDRRDEIRRDLLNMDPEDIPAYVAELDSQGELQVVNEWLVANGMSPMSADLFDQSNDVVGANNPVVASPQEAEELGLELPTEPPASEDVLLATDQALAENEAGPEWQNAFDDAVSVAAASYADHLLALPEGFEPDQSTIDVPAGYTPEQEEKFLNEVILRGEEQWAETVDQQLAATTKLDEDERQGVIDEQRRNRQLLGDTDTPTWLLQLNGGTLSDDQKRRYIDYWNDAHGTFYSDFERDLAPILARYDGTEAAVINFAQGVLSEQQPIRTTAFQLPLITGNRSVTFTEEQLADARAMGFSDDALNRLVRIVGGLDPDGLIRPDGTANIDAILPLAALARYYGGSSELADYQARDQEIGQIESSLGLRPGSYSRMTAEERRAARAEAEAKALSPAAQTAVDESFGRIDELLRQQALREEKGRLPGIMAANNMFRRGMEQYRGDQFLAFVHAVDPALAQRVASHTDPDEPLDWEDNARVYDILRQAGAIQDDGKFRLRQLEDVRGFFGYFASAGGGGGGAGPVRRMVDPVSVGQQVQELWSRLFLADVDDATVAAITANLQKQLDEAPDGMSFDVSSRIMAFLQGQDVYDTLYRNKPEGLTEEEYQSQFAAGIADVIGNELDPEALKSGMKTGDYNVSVGRAAAGERLLTSSTLRGRWAGAKQTLDRFS